MLVIDSTSPINQGYVQAITAQISDPNGLANFNAFLQLYPVVDFNNPDHAAAARQCCTSTNGPSCTFPITIQPKFD